LFNANTEEDLKRLEALEVPDMEQAIGAYRQVSATDEFKEIERLRERARHNEASALRHAATQAADVERAKWQKVIAKKDAENAATIAEQAALIAKLQARLDEK